MGHFEEVVKALDSPPHERWNRFDKILDKLRKKDALTIKKVLDQVQEELEDLRVETSEIIERKEEIETELKTIQKEKEMLTQKAVEAEITVFKEIQIAIDKLKETQLELEDELVELGEPDEDNDIDAQKISTYCENWGNQHSLIDLWASAVYKLKVLLANKLES